MAFDFFSQPRGPEIDVNLFPNAATRGIAAGNAQKTIAESIVGGIEQGLDLYGKYQNTVIRENQIDQIPVQNRVEEAQADNAESIAQLNALRAREAAATESLTLQVATLEAQNKATVAETQATDLKNQQDIISTLSTDDVTSKKGILDNPDYKETLFRNPKLLEKVLGDLTRQNLLSEEEQKNGAAFLDFGQTTKFQQEMDKVNAQWRQKLLAQNQKAETELIESPAFQYIATQGQFQTPEDFQSRVKVYPKGVKTTNEQGVLLPDVPDKPVEEPGKYTAYLDNKPVMDLSEKEAGIFNTYANSTREYSKVVRDNIFGVPLPPAKKPEQSAGPQQNLLGLPPDATGNQQIVEQARQNFDALKKNAPPGMSMGTLEERLKTQKEKIRSGVADYKQKRSAQQLLFDMTSDQIAQSATQNLNRAAPLPTPPEPSAALSAAIKQPVSLNLEFQPRIEQAVWDTVQSEPLLANETAIIKGLAAVESRGKINALSPTGVRGILQVTRDTARQYGFNRDIPEQNLTAGKLYLYDNLLRFNGNLMLSLAAYNAGHGTISDAIRSTQSTRWPVIKNHLKDVLTPAKFKEVSEYPERVISMSSQFLGQDGENDASFVYLLQQNGLINQTGV